MYSCVYKLCNIKHFLKIKSYKSNSEILTVQGMGIQKELRRKKNKIKVKGKIFQEWESYLLGLQRSHKIRTEKGLFF